jgi:hypothetical protein
MISFEWMKSGVMESELTCAMRDITSTYKFHRELSKKDPDEC